MSTPWWIWPTGYAGLIVLSFIWTKIRAPGFDVKDKHVFITGGSSGLGLSFAIKCAKRGAKVSIVARSQEKLEAAKREIETAAIKGEVFIQSTDVTSYESVKSAIAAANKFHKQATDKLVCCAGLAAPGLMMDQDISVYHKMMDLNYFGVVNTVKAALPAMIEAKNKGHVIIISSALSLMSFVGYTQYASSKYAVRGFAEALRNELKLYDMKATVFHPGNIDSPGFVEENRTKPAVTYEIEGVSTPIHPDSVADSLFSGLADGHFAITNDPLLFVLRVITNGVAPRFNSPLEVLMFPLAVIIQMGFGLYMDFLVAKEGKKMAAKPKTT